MSAFFVTGSGTDVGKTFVTAGLVRALKAHGRAVDVLKPVVSGYNADNPAGSDPAVLLEALARPQTEENLAQISPWRFRAPLSPDMAAATEGRAIDMAAVTAFCREAVADGEGRSVHRRRRRRHGAVHRAANATRPDERARNPAASSSQAPISARSAMR